MARNGCSWLSEGFEVLIAEQSREPEDYDVVIVGSGYGGAVAASRLALAHPDQGGGEERLRVALLERGKEYLPGMFPDDMAELPGHVRVSTPYAWGQTKTEVAAAGQRDGLFDIRVDDDYNVLVANGLGGGSLINAGVMEQPTREVFDERWPAALRGGEELLPWYEAMREQLGARYGGIDNTISQHALAREQPLSKHAALRDLQHNDSLSTFREAAITVAMADGRNNASVSMSRCKLCGDCATGCNFGAKDSLDLNLLARARRGGLRIFTGATVLRVRPDGAYWRLEVVHTRAALARKEKAPFSLRTRRVILSAGALGSTEILLRSRSAELPLSATLGSRFSGNGDMIAVGYDMTPEVNAVATASQPWDERGIGPTITGVIDRRTPDNPVPVVIEEMAVPGAMAWVFSELYTTVNSLHQLARADWSPHADGHPAADPFSIDPRAIQHSQVYAVIGDDGSAGVLELREDFSPTCDGAISIRWPEVRQHSLFSAQIEQLTALTQSAGVGGAVIPNPLWQPLPDSLKFLAGGLNGPLMTVHPLGGCPMGDDAGSGTVDSLGRVFTGRGDELHEGLVVLDGAIVPGAVGTNPALTIAAVAARAVAGLCQNWGLSVGPEPEPLQFTDRPAYSVPEAPVEPEPTVMQIAERLRGQVCLDLGAGAADYVAELTLFFDHKTLADLTALEETQKREHSLVVAPVSPTTGTRSELRLFELADWREIDAERLSGRELEERLAAASVVTAPLAGTLTIMARERSRPLSRTLRVLWAWLGNRGWRDIWQRLFPKPQEREQHRQQSFGSFFRMCRVLLHYMSRAGEVRLFEYDLQIGPLEQPTGVAAAFEDAEIRGVKRIGYMRRGNPLRQLMQVHLERFPGLVAGRPARLDLRPEFLARRGLPLFRISRQQDLVRALADVGSLATYFLRMLASTHLLSLRAPDRAAPRQPQRLPAAIAAGEPQRFRVEVTRLPEGVPASHAGELLLSRYARPDSSHPPVILIHGYSASGTTFAHHAVNPNLADHLWRRGRDVWVLDMRSSCGMPTRRENYSFEELAYADIPLAVAEVRRIAQCEKVDVVAHCMGAAMLSMAILTAGSAGARGDDVLYPEAHRALPDAINRVVLSQVGPLVCLAPDNVFRAYAFSYLKHFLPLDQYQFEPSQTPFDEVLDRVLSILPYDEAEFDLENPCLPWRRTPWTLPRHRMDLLYGRTFELENLSQATLDHIEDFFGPLSVDTATQVLHFARFQTITDHSGNNLYVSRDNLEQCWNFPTLSIHGRRNGLSWRSTLGRMERILKRDAGRDWRGLQFDQFGHQDCLIGRGAEPIFTAVGDFLDEDGAADCSAAEHSLLIQAPWSGPTMAPVQTEAGAAVLPLSFGINPALSRPRLLLALPLDANGALLPASGGAVEMLVNSLDSAEVEYNWCKLRLRLPQLEQSYSSMLLLLVYEESDALDNALFGKEPGDMDEFPGVAALAADQPWLRADGEAAAAAALKNTEGLEQCLRKLLTEAAGTLRPGVIRLPFDGADDQLLLAAGSCQFPPGILDQWPGFNSYYRLARRCRDGAAPDLVLLTGDQIYVDSTAGLFDPASRDERYQHPYQRWYRSSAVRAVLRQAPVAMMLDDHEITDNFETIPGDESNRQRGSDGIGYARMFQSWPAPPGQPSQGLWHNFSRRGFEIFMLDTRTQRSPRDAAGVALDSERIRSGEPCQIDILSNSTTEDRTQREALEDWLQRMAAAEDPCRPKFLVCPAMPFPRERRAIASDVAAIHSDSWSGYPGSQAWLIERLQHYRIRNLIMLNGDAHLCCLATITLPASALTYHSIHASGLYSPLPFANERPQALAGSEEFVLPNGIEVAVDTEFAPRGDGFALLAVRREQDAWMLDVSFDREGVSDPAWPRQIRLPFDCERPVP